MVGRSCSTRLFPIDFRDRFVIKLPENLEGPTGRVRVCPVPAQHYLHGLWKYILINALVAIELKLQHAIV